jgi:hypothetical protein
MKTILQKKITSEQKIALAETGIFIAAVFFAACFAYSITYFIHHPNF